MRRTILTIIWVFTTALVPGFAGPGEFRPAEVSAKASWFAHLDLANLRSSEIGQQLIGELDGEAKRQLRQLERMLNFHPIDDLQSATVYGTSSDPEKAVALIRGSFDVKRLTGVAIDAEDYTAIAHGDSTIHSWKDGNKRIYATIPSAELIIIGADLELLKSAFDVTAGNGAPIDPAKLFGHTQSDRPPIVVAAANLSALGTLDIDSSLVRKIKSIYLSAGETGGELSAHVVLKTADARSAKLIDQMLHGVLALAEASDEVPQEVITAFKTQLSEDSVSLTVSLPMKKFKDLVAKLEKAAEGLK
jgi:hypothetical protein